MLEAQTGQQVNISLLNIGVSGDSSLEVDEAPDCHEYGYVVDKIAMKNVSICGGKTNRQQNVYSSKSNVLEIVMTSSAERNYLISFQGQYFYG